MSIPALKDSDPKFTTSGTMAIPRSRARPGSMSDAESVTMATRLTVDPPWRRTASPVASLASAAAPPSARMIRAGGTPGPRWARTARYPVAVNRSLKAVLVGTFTLRFSTGLTGLLLSFYLKHTAEHHGLLDQVLGLGMGVAVLPITFSIVHSLFYVSELGLSPIFGVLSDRLGHYRVMQYGPIFGILAAGLTWATTNVPLIGATRLLEGSATASSVPSILGFISGATAHDEGLRGRAVARFEAATLGGLLGGFVAAGVLWDALGPAAFLVNAVVYGVSLAIYRYGVNPRDDPRPEPAAGQRPK